MGTRSPLTADDLRRVAKSLDEWSRLLTDSKSDSYKSRAELVKSIEILRPDADDVIGRFVLIDGWVGFDFEAES